jgi:heptosyltransferase-2
VSNAHPAQDAGRAGEQRVVVRLPNWVGDVCMALPALAALHAQGLALHCFGKAWAGDLLAGLPYRVHRLPTGLFAAAAALRAVGAQRALSLTNSFGSALQLRLAGLRTVGYRQELRGPLLAVAVPRRAGRHECESFWHLAQVLLSGAAAAPATLPPPPPRLDLPLTAEHRASAHAALAAAGVEGAFSVLCPLSVGLSAGRSKQWPSFPLLCRGLLEQGDAVVACPGPGEEAACAAALPGARLLPGLGLGAYAGVMALSRRVVANDSGPLHLAAAVGAPVLGIFGVSDPARTRPWGEGSAIVGDWHGWPTVQAVWETLSRLPHPAPAAARETHA